MSCFYFHKLKDVVVVVLLMFFVLFFVLENRENQSNQNETSTVISAPAIQPTSKNILPEERKVPPLSNDKGALLSSINQFCKVNLKATETNDRSSPKV